MSNLPANRIEHHDGGISLIGREATNLMHVKMVQLGIKMHINSGGRMRMTRGASISYLLECAAKITGKKYNYRKKEDIQRAMEEVSHVFTEAKTVIPQIDNRSQP
jgi:hypothetical protein